MSTPQVLMHRDGELLAKAVAASSVHIVMNSPPTWRPGRAVLAKITPWPPIRALALAAII